MKTNMSCALLLIILWFSPEDVSAECCYGSDDDYCRDGSGASPYCGVGNCNFFGCNCAGGCRGNRQIQDFHPFDKNQDGQVDLQEALQGVKKRSISKQEARNQFHAYDVDGNGYLDSEELEATNDDNEDQDFEDGKVVQKRFLGQARKWIKTMNPLGWFDSR